MPGWVSGSGGQIVPVEETVSLADTDRARWIPSNAASDIRSLDGERGFVGFIGPAISREFYISGVAYYLAKPGTGAVSCEIYSLDRYNLPTERVVRSVHSDVSGSRGLRQILFPAVPARKYLIGLNFSEVVKDPEMFFMLSSPYGVPYWPNIADPTSLFVGMPDVLEKRFAPSLSIRVTRNA